MADPAGEQAGAGTVAPTPEELRLELARAEAERDAALAALDKEERRERRGSRTRRTVAGVLVVLFVILLPVTYVVAWTHYVVLTNRGFEKTVVPIGTDPAVAAAVGTTLTNQIFTSLNAQQTVKNALPPKADFLAGPITNAARGYVQQGVTAALQSQRFQALWKETVDFAHAQLLSILKGNSKAVTTSNGQVVLNLVPLFDAALQNLQGFVSGVVGRPVTIPDVSANEIPASACQTIGNAINRPLPSNCGQIPLFPADKLTQARHLVRSLQRGPGPAAHPHPGGGGAGPLVVPASAAHAAATQRRRRARAGGDPPGGGLAHHQPDQHRSAANTSARRAILTHLFHQYFSISRWLLLGLIAVFVVALVTGPYAWAVPCAGSSRTGAGRYGTCGFLLRTGAG